MNWFVRYILTFGWAGAITLAPFGIYIREEYFEWNNDYNREHNTPAYQRWCEVINEEKTHWAQQLEMLVIFFYPWYLVEWIIKILTPPVGAYKDLGFEREAKANRDNPDYLKIRKHFAWCKYIRKA